LVDELRLLLRGGGGGGWGDIMRWKKEE